MPPMTLLIKPASGNCNLRCKYCFYTDEAEKRTCASFGKMSQDIVQIAIDKALHAADRTCTFAFQGGEPTLAGLPFYQSVSSYIDTHPNPKHIAVQYTFQTNGILLDEAWAEWFVHNRVLVGVSLDGPKDVHDRYRVDRDGRGTFQRVMRAIQLLEKYHVEYNILSVITSASARSGRQIYHFFQKNGFRYQQYIECLDPIGEDFGQNDFSLTPKRYERFLKDLFDAWWMDLEAGQYYYNRYFENLLLMMDGKCPESCNLRGTCGLQWVIEADGSVYPCDFYALDAWCLGNIQTDSFDEMTKRAAEFLTWPQQIPSECQTCHWFGLCRNGCRRNREPVTAHSSGRNRFCSAYQNFLEYAYPRLLKLYSMRKMGQNWRVFQYLRED